MNKVFILLILFVILYSFRYFEKYEDSDKFRDVIVKIFSQNIDYDYLEPYKNSDSYESIGTGFFIDTDTILTASHVVQDSIRLDITIPSIGKKKFKTELICFNPYYYFAILKDINLEFLDLYLYMTLLL